MTLDYQIFQIINGFAGRSGTLDWLGIFCAKYLIFVIFLAAAILAFFYKSQRHWMGRILFATKVFLSGIFAYVLKFIIVFFYDRPRPFTSHVVNQLVERSGGGSFPSTHSAVAFGIAFSIYFYNKKLGVLFLILAAFVGLGRIYVGVHYPLDIIGGVVVGWLAAFVIEKIFKKLPFKI